jgi:DNA polymerase I-like protein with 3'-5' exonuclease and polymerase domains
VAWSPNQEFPPIKDGAVIALDTETYNQDLMKLGPRFITGDDHVVGFSVAVEGGATGYWPVAHSSGNTSLDARNWLRCLFDRKNVTIVFANAKFDLAGLSKYTGGVPRSRLVDIQTTAALLDENQMSYTLDNIGKRMGFPGKDKHSMEAWMLEAGMVREGKPDYGRMREIPPEVVAPYAIMDAELTLAIHLAQQPLVDRDDLRTVYDLECDLVPITFGMTLRGVRVDYEKAEVMNDKLLAANDKLLAALRNGYPGTLEPFAADSLEKYVNHLGRTPPRTTKGAPSVTNEWLASTGDTNLKLLAEYRQAERFRRDVLEGLVLERSYNDRIHAEWFSTRGSGAMSANGNAGTRSGRLSSTNPSLQVIPTRHPVHGSLSRSLFLPEVGARWCKLDYSSQEIRVALHYAVLLKFPGAEVIRDEYRKDPKTDYHAKVRDMVNAVVTGGHQIDRNQAKTVNLAMAYYMGKSALAEALGVDLAVSNMISADYHRAVPYVKPLMDFCKRVADERGFVKTLLGRRRRFDEYENAAYGATWEPPLRKEAAADRWPRIRRAATYRALNSIVQGTSAEMTKLALRDLVKAGFEPMITLHDETDLSVSSVEEAQAARAIMETALKLDIPIVADGWIGDDWSGKNKVILS